MDNVSRFLIDLAVNPGQQEAFAKEPGTIMNEVGLSETEQELLKRGNRAQISASLADEFSQPAYCVYDPNPDPWPEPDPPPPPDDSDSTE
jgi:hypothetical protein